MAVGARDYALRELDARMLPGWRAGQVRRGPRGVPDDPRDRGLGEQIIAGVVKNVLLLQHLISHYSGRSLRSVDPVAQKVLAIGLYQLRFLERIPPSAAVDEAVEQARRFGIGKAAGFINAVLRNATREPNPPLPSRDDPAKYAEIVLSHPRPLFDRLVKLAGTKTALQICEHNNREPPTIVRLFPGHSIDELAGDGITPQPHEQAGMVVVAGARQATFAQWARAGIAQVQDPTAARVAEQLDLQPGQTVLDRCCGLGTKTIQLRQRIGDSGQVIAIDPNRRRIDGLRKLIAERGLTGVHPHKAAMLAELGDKVPQIYDRALIDAPCSNSGTFARRPEARYADSEQATRSLIALQDQILDDTAPHVRPGGLLIYSTCSIWPEENQARVEAFLSRHGDYERLSEDCTLPSLSEDPTRYRDGGYYAVLRRRPG